MRKIGRFKGIMSMEAIHLMFHSFPPLRSIWAGTGFMIGLWWLQEIKRCEDTRGMKVAIRRGHKETV
jgi:hypothetical protein